MLHFSKNRSAVLIMDFKSKVGNKRMLKNNYNSLPIREERSAEPQAMAGRSLSVSVSFGASVALQRAVLLHDGFLDHDCTD